MIGFREFLCSSCGDPGIFSLGASYSPLPTGGSSEPTDGSVLFTRNAVCFSSESPHPGSAAAAVTRGRRRGDDANGQVGLLADEDGENAGKIRSACSRGATKGEMTLDTEKRGLDALTEREWKLVDEMAEESTSPFSPNSISIRSS